jgi:hypothetical protein
LTDVMGLNCDSGVKILDFWAFFFVGQSASFESACCISIVQSNLSGLRNGLRYKESGVSLFSVELSVGQSRANRLNLFLKPVSPGSALYVFGRLHSLSQSLPGSRRLCSHYCSDGRLTNQTNIGQVEELRTADINIFV